MTNPANNQPRRLKINHGARPAPQQPQSGSRAIAPSAQQPTAQPRMGNGPINKDISLPWGAIKKNQRDMLDRESIEFHNVICNDAITRIRESMFVMEMLPFLFDEIPDFVKNDPENQMTAAKWIAAAGGPHHEFDVVSDATGEVLFRVPAFVNRELYDMKAAASKGRFNNMFNFAKQLSHLSPNQAAAFTEYQFTDRGKSNDREAVIAHIQERWNAIFRRYGRPTLTYSKDEGAASLKPADGKGAPDTPAASRKVEHLASPQDHQNDGFYF